MKDYSRICAVFFWLWAATCALITVWLVLPVNGQQTLHPKRGTIWITWEENGSKWMVGALKEYGRADNDPGFVQTDFSKGYSIKVQGSSGTGDGLLFHNCCTTNILISPNYTGTITLGTNVFKVSALLKAKQNP